MDNAHNPLDHNASSADDASQLIETPAEFAPDDAVDPAASDDTLAETGPTGAAASEEPPAPATKKKTTKKTAKKSAKKTTKKSTKKTTKKSSKKTTKKSADEDKPEPEQDNAPQADADVETASVTEPVTESVDDTDSKAGDSKPKRKAAAKKTTKRAARRKDDDEPKASSEHEPQPDADMLINYVPGEECRIAIVEDGMLEEFYSEPTDRVSRVGNIYVGKVTNVESAIQAAFVDFGLEEAGFLHISDIHPQYFPGEDDDTTESVGKKVPRRERPPIQKCLKRGQEIIVQVLKEGVGTKGPTLTSYLSVPGRFLVMMPQMDRVGVSRKEEDDDKRKEAKKILSQLDLPEGFGFILRTAGFGRTKTDLKRDLAYLQRLWKDMEKRRKAGGKPRPLYSESDLLVRSLRDLLGTHVKRIIVDDEIALQRTARFMKIVAPRSQAKLMHHKGNAPVFHAFDIERQIREIHSREVPLPSGGRLVIDQTEALVAIDVNSGRSKKAKDAETNAYQTNLEAVDAICRQLRLRDLGGLVINDLIDMRHHKRRREIENRFRDRLKRDRARATILPISEFGILEMTRQRMRGSQESLHFGECPSCRGRGLLQKADSVAADALRELAALIDNDRIERAELVVNSKVAGALLSTRRQSLTRVELTSGKRIDVRVSDTLPVDRVTFYAYDEHGSDVDLNKLARQKRKAPKLEEVVIEKDSQDEDWAVDPAVDAEEIAAARLAEQLQRAADAAAERADAIMDLTDADDDDDSEDEGSGRKRKRRRRRGGRKRRGSRDDDQQTSNSDGADKDDQHSADEPHAEAKDIDTEEAGASDAEDNDSGSRDSDETDEDRPKRKRRRRRRGGRNRRSGEDASDADRSEDRDEDTSSNESSERSESDGDADADKGDRPRKRRGRRGRGSRSGSGSDEAADNNGDTGGSKPASARPVAAEAKPATKPRRRGLYAASRRKLSASEVATRPKDD